MNPKQKPLSDQALDLIAARFKVMADPMRLRLLHALKSGERNVTELVALTGGGQANVSKHLAILTNASLVARRKDGLNTFYFIADPVIFKLCELMCSSLQRDLDQKAAQFS